MNKEQILEQALRNILEGVNAPDIDPMGDVEFGLHCGVEDIGATDKYDGANYGYSQGVEATLEWAANEVQSALEAVTNETDPIAERNAFERYGV